PYFLYKYKNYIGLPLVSSVGETKHMQSGLVKLAPNPAGETVKVELHSETDFISEVQIIDQQGRTVTVQSLDNTGSKAAWVNISHLGKGLYIVETSTQQKAVYYNKLIKH
ncbi:MAG: T9SS type A sorting domain-containing protein, partial [Bacteroidales bacterium]